MNLLKNSTLRQRLAFGTGVLAVGGLIYGVYRRHQKEKEEAQILLKQTEDIANLKSESDTLVTEINKLTREVASLQTVNSVLGRKLEDLEALEAEEDAKQVPVRDRVLEVESKTLANSLKTNSGTASGKRPTKVINQDAKKTSERDHALKVERQMPPKDLTTNSCTASEKCPTKAINQDAKKTSVRDHILKVENQMLPKDLTPNSSTASGKRPTKVRVINQGDAMFSRTSFLEELKTQVAKRLAEEKET